MVHQRFSEPVEAGADYPYFVSYAIVGDRPALSGFGNSEIFLREPVTSMADVEKMAEMLGRKVPAGASVCVLWFQPMPQKPVVIDG